MFFPMFLVFFVLGSIMFLAVTNKPYIPYHIQVCKNGAWRNRQTRLFVRKA